MKEPPGTLLGADTSPAGRHALMLLPEGSWDPPPASARCRPTVLSVIPAGPSTARTLGQGLQPSLPHAYCRVF